MLTLFSLNNYQCCQMWLCYDQRQPPIIWCNLFGGSNKSYYKGVRMKITDIIDIQLNEITKNIKNEHNKIKLSHKQCEGMSKSLKKQNKKLS